MSMNLGTLLVRMNAETKALAKGMREGVREVQQAAQAMKRMAAEVATAGAAVTGFFAGMVKAAAGVDFGVKKSLDRLKDSFLTLAVQVAHMVMPAMQQLGQLLRDVAGWFNGLPAGTKQAISDFALFAVKAGAIALALSKLSGLINGLMGLFSGLASVVAAIGAGPVMVFLAGLAAVIALVAVLHKAWRQNWGGIQETTKSVIETISKWWSKFKDFLSDLWVDAVEGVRKAVITMLGLWEQAQVAFGRDPEKAARQRQAGELAVNDAARMVATPGKAQALILEAAKALKAGGLDLANEIGLIVKEIRSALGLDSSGGSAGGVTSSKVGMGGAREMYSEATENAIKHALDKSQRIGGAGALKSGSDVRAAAESFWEGLESLGPVASNIVAFGSQLKDAFKAGLEQLGGAMKFGGELMLSKMGELGQVIQSGIQGFQQGGVWGAIIAVFIELLSRFERFQEIMDIGAGQIKQLIDQLAPALNTVIDALRAFMGASGMLTNVVLTLLAPIFDVIGKSLEALVPSIMSVAVLLEMLQPVFDFLGQVLGVVFQGIGYVMRAIGVVVLGIMLGILNLYKGILNVLLDTIGQIDQGLGDKLKAELGRVGVEIANTENLAKRMAETGLVDVANAAADASEGIGKMGNAADEATEQLLNVPEGYKVAMDRFAAMATSSTGASFGSISSGDESRALFLKTGNPSRARFFTKGK